MAIPSATKRIGETLWEIPVSYKEGMLVPARIYMTDKLMKNLDDGVFQQITNVATLPGILKYACCMPDGHSGYGFPIGGIAAMDTRSGVISPGGIGFDINCGMRLISTNLTCDEVKPRLRELVNSLFRSVPAGVGGKSFLKIDQDEFCEVVEKGARWCVENGYGRKEDLERTEENGCISAADSSKVSQKAIDRGYRQVGTLGSGNHYLEIQVARPEHVFDEKIARVYGIKIPNQVMVMFHCGSRGFGHQVASDYLQSMLKVMEKKYKIRIFDRELACAPFQSPEGQHYFAAMNCAINMAFANRQMILHRIREVFCDVFERDERELGLDMVYDVCHNTAKLEKHEIDGKAREVLVHRKGATRAFPPGMDGIPEIYKDVGQPIIIGGSMETGSYLLAGTSSAKETFFSTSHGSGRVMSRTKARKKFHGKKLLQEMDARGIYVRAVSHKGLAEEAGGAYKDIDEVIEAADLAGLGKKVARFVPIGNVKG